MSQSMPPPPPPMMPMGQPGTVGYMQPGLPTRTSAAAVTSLICGVLGCFIVTGIAAIITGVIGLKATRDPQVKGRGLAIAGLILGVITTLGGGACLAAGGAGLFFANAETNKALVAVDALTKAAAANDIDAAMAVVDSAYLTRADVERLIATVQPQGQPGPYKKSGFNANANMGSKPRFEVTGTVPYPAGDRKIDFVIEKQSDGTYKIVGYKS